MRAGTTAEQRPATEQLTESAASDPTSCSFRWSFCTHDRGASCLLGGLLLLLFLLLLFLLGDKESEDLLGLDHVVLIDVELTEDVVDLGLGHLVSPGLESVLEHLDVHLALNVVGLEGLDDEVIGVVAVSGHLPLEHLDHVVVGAGAADLSEETVEL